MYSVAQSMCNHIFSYFNIFLFRYGMSQVDSACVPYIASSEGSVFSIDSNDSHPIGSDGTRSGMDYPDPDFDESGKWIRTTEG